ncbi:MAG: phage holin family protein [Bacteroidales bacterium]|nr:phage holin family protein [Bacteroidales bacterium]
MNLSALKEMTILVGIACIIVFFAMMIDLASGLYKAKQRHEIRSSWGLKRTLSKFIMYEGGMLIAAGVDMLLYVSRLFELFHLTPIVGIPVVTCLIGIFLLVVEFMSIREKSDKKTKKDFNDAGEMIMKLLESKTVKDALAKAIEVQAQQSAMQQNTNVEQINEEP